ncbi:MAG: hypothetical protein Q7T16_05020 [Candidatus Burarchaeum sp.]|nr:hypothetical protein [Candidatus Burarchaeum sp.]MDO8339991.1 hypothetical protein [Candidatus Burarchaeum sp.]
MKILVGCALVILALAAMAPLAFASCKFDADCAAGYICKMSAYKPIGEPGECEAKAVEQDCADCESWCDNDGTYYAVNVQASQWVPGTLCTAMRCKYYEGLPNSPNCVQQPPSPVPVAPAKAVDKIYGYIYYKNDVGGLVPLKNAKVMFEYADAQGQRTEDPNDFAWLDANGKFEWRSAKALAPGNTVDLLIYFTDSAGTVSVTAIQGGGRTSGFYMDRGIASNDTVLAYYDKELTAWDQKPLSHIYLNMLKAVEFREKALKFTPIAMERVTAFDPNHGTSHLSEVYVNEAPNDIGMRIKSADSVFGLFAAPTNREFHEYCHHIQAEAQPEKRNPLGDDHAGYYNNPDSEWGLIEGWAEFCALEMKRYFGMGKRGNYEVGKTVWNLEENYLIDAPKRKTAEELAIAGIMLDLRDSVNDYGAHDDEAVALPLSDIWAAFSQKRDFGDGQGMRYVHSLRDFYLAINEVTKGNVALHSPYLARSGQTELDHVFVMHHTFQDTNSNGKWDEGEDVGYSGKGGLVRSDLTEEPGTDVVFDVKDQNGNAMGEGISAFVEVNLEPPNYYLSYSYTIPLVDGMTAVPLPPEEYNATITMTAVSDASGERADSSFSTTTSELYEKIDPGRPFATYSATIKVQAGPVQPKPEEQVICATDAECGEDFVCSNGACERIMPPPPNCLSVALIMFMLAGAFAAAKRRK